MPAFDFILRWVTFVMWLFWLFHYWHGLRGIREEFQKTIMEARTRFDRGLVSFLGVITLSPLAMILLASFGLLTVQPWARPLPVVAAGTLATLLGMLAAYFSRRHLGKCWTSRIDVPEHQIVDSGPYRIVRHPIYTAMLVMHLGITVVFATWWTWVIFGLIALCYVLKALAEERVLASHSEDYRAYQQYVRFRLVPGIW